ncbi:MAG: hypothetical protein IT302_07365 [Dehalococcoidia bacterium]|nr:hypothetical protein [Dehalococcoidia bacterium]
MAGESVHAEQERAANRPGRERAASPQTTPSEPIARDLRAPGPAQVLGMQRALGNRTVSRRLAESATTLARKTSGLGAPAAAPATAGVVQREFTSASSRSSHFSKHSSDFSYGSEDEYEEAADDHYANRGSYQSKVSGGKTYVYDDSTDTIGVYTAAGKVITFFKPCHNNQSKVDNGDGQSYYDKQ